MMSEDIEKKEQMLMFCIITTVVQVWMLFSMIDIYTIFVDATHNKKP